MLFKKMLRDIRNNKTSFIAIFLMTFIGMFIYNGITSEWNGMGTYSQKFYEESNLADSWIMNTSFQDEDINYLKHQDKIENVEDRLLLTVQEKDNNKSNIELYALTTSSISKIDVEEGMDYDNSTDGVWIDSAYAKEHGLQLHGIFTMVFQNVSISKEIVGFVNSPEHIYTPANNQMMPDHKNNGFAFISKQTEPLLQDIPPNQLLIKSTADKEELQTILQSNTSLKGSTLIMQNEHLSVSTLESEIIQHKAMGDIFPLAFLLIGILTTITTMTKLTMDQRTQIGILQALGFKNKKILFHYVSHGFIISTIGCITGFFVGPLLLPQLIYPMLTIMYNIPHLQGTPLDSSYIMVFFCIVICFFASYASCFKQLRELPAYTLRPCQHAYNTKRNFTNLSNHISFYAKWNLRDISRNKLRSFMTCFGVLGCSALIFCAAGIYDTMSSLTTWYYHDLQSNETKINLKQMTDLSALDELKTTVEGEFLMETAIEISSDTISKSGSITVQESDTFLHMQDTNKDYIPLPNDGIALSYKIAEALQFQEGDTILWRLYGDNTWQTSKIATIIRTPVAQGITISKTVFEKMYPFTPTSILTNESMTDIPDNTLISSILQKKDLMRDMDTMMESMITLIAVLIFGATILGSVVLYNLAALSFLERLHELATLKVLGFSTKQLKKLSRQQNFWLTSIGIIAGLPAGYALIWVMIHTIGDSMDILININFITYIITILGTLLISMFINYILAKKLKTIDMVNALKANE